MDFVSILRVRDGIPAAQRDAALARRAVWQYPNGIEPVAEYWTPSPEHVVVSVFRADSYEAIMEVQLEWNDVFDFTILPAISAEEGLRIGPDVFGRLPRLRHT